MSTVIPVPIIGDHIQPRLTVDGLRDLIQDLRRTPAGVPWVILLSEYDRRDLNQDLMAGGSTPVLKKDHEPAADGYSIGVIEGVVIRSSPEISRGRARLCWPDNRTSIL